MSTTPHASQSQKRARSLAALQRLLAPPDTNRKSPHAADGHGLYTVGLQVWWLKQSKGGRQGVTSISLKKHGQYVLKQPSSECRTLIA
jgi:hypothetical protein